MAEQVYQPRNPKASPLWRCVDAHFEEFLQVYSERYQPRYGVLRDVIPEVVGKFLECGDLEKGFARACAARNAAMSSSWRSLARHAGLAPPATRRRCCSSGSFSPATCSPRSPIATGSWPFDPQGGFHPLPEEIVLWPLEEMFRRRVIAFLVDQELLPRDRAEMLLSWRHSGLQPAPLPPRRP